MKTNMLVRTALLCLSISFSAPVLAIYKCESNGKVIYSDAPCAGGKALDISNVSPTDAAAAKRQLAQEQSKLRKIEGERLKREAIEEKERQRIARDNEAKQRRCTGLAQRKKWADEDAAAATGKASEKARRKANRATEQFEATCGK